MRIYTRAVTDHAAEEACRRIEEQWMGKAQQDDERAMLDLLARFRPLCAKCARRAGTLLPWEEYDILLAEVHYEFLLLLSEFEPRRGVPFAGYMVHLLPRRVFDWAKKEQQHLHREITFAGDEKLTDEGFHPNHVVDIQISAKAEEGEAILQVWWEQAIDQLTQRQRQAMQLMLQGLTEREIAEKLKVSCVRTHQLKCEAQKKLKEMW